MATNSKKETPKKLCETINLKSLSTDIIDNIHSIEEDLIKNINGKYNFAAAQRVRVKTIHLQRMAKLYRSLSLEQEKLMRSKAPIKLKPNKTALKKTNVTKKAK